MASAAPVPLLLSDIEWRIRVRFDGVTWVDITRDVLEGAGVDYDRGIDGDGPQDLTARSGMLTFWMNNSEDNSVGLLGYYSTGHRNCRLGWNIGVHVMVEMALRGLWEPQWVGRVTDIVPEHGVALNRRVAVTAKDWMEEAAEHTLNGLPTLVNKRSNEIITELAAAVPVQPVGGLVLDQGLDVFPILFDDIRDGKTTAMTELGKIDRSGLTHTFITRDGALRHQSRHSRNASPQNLFTLDGTMRDVYVSRARKSVINRVEVTVHPRRVANDIAVLWSLEDKPFIGPGQTLEPIRGDYTDPENRSQRVGAVDVQVPLVAGQDYIASIQQALASGIPDTPATLRPNGDGFYTGDGSAADLADESDSSGIEYPGLGIKRSVTLSDVTAASNAAVASVRVKVRIDYTPGPGNIDGTGFGGFFIFYPSLRLNGIEVPINRLGTAIASYDAYGPAGPHEAEFDVPTPPGGGVWTVAAVNAAELVWHWNVGGDVQELSLVRAEMRLLYAAAVEELDRTANVAVAVDAGGNAATFTPANSGADGAFLARLQIRGRPVFKDAPVTSLIEGTDPLQLGERTERMDMSYQPDVNKGTLIGRYVLDLFGAVKDRAGSVTFLGNLSEEHMAALLRRDIGDRIGLIEEVTGLSDQTADGQPAGYHIQNVAVKIRPGPEVLCTWGLKPADSRKYWHAGVTTQTEAGQGTVVGPA